MNKSHIEDRMDKNCKSNVMKTTKDMEIVFNKETEYLKKAQREVKLEMENSGYPKNLASQTGHKVEQEIKLKLHSQTRQKKWMALSKKI